MPMSGLAQLPFVKLFVQSCWSPDAQLFEPGKQRSPAFVHVLPAMSPHVQVEHSGGPAGSVNKDSGMLPSAHGMGVGGAPRP